MAIPSKGLGGSSKKFGHGGRARSYAVSYPRDFIMDAIAMQDTAWARQYRLKRDSLRQKLELARASVEKIEAKVRREMRYINELEAVELAYDLGDMALGSPSTLPDIKEVEVIDLMLDA